VDKIKLNSPDEQLEDVRLCVFNAHGTRASASDQALEVLAGQQQVAFEAMHQLGKIKTSNVSWKNYKKLRKLTRAVSSSGPTRNLKSVISPFSRAFSFFSRSLSAEVSEEDIVYWWEN